MLSLVILLTVQASAVPEDLSINSFNNAFYVASGGVGYYNVNSGGGKPGRGEFWRVCEQIEMLEDAAQRSNESIYQHMIGELVNGLNGVVSGTDNWASWNNYNDDVMWGVIALVRSYQLTGNKDHLTQAEIQFNAVWARGWDTVDGGMYWNTSRITKNACVNGPTAIAGFLLAQSTTGTGFQAQAAQAYDWLKANLYVEATGQVYDHVDPDGHITDWAFTYNQGTFIGAATLYSLATQQSSYLADAQKAAQWSQTHLTGQHEPGILNDEYSSGSDDSAGFKGIFARWASFYGRVAGDSDILSWLQANSDSAWANRNSVGITWGQWWRRTPDKPATVTSWECSSAAAINQFF